MTSTTHRMTPTSTMSGVSTTACTGGILDQINCNAGSAGNDSGESVDALAAAIVGSLVSAGVQVIGFLILRIRLSRIYRPRSYLVAERERVPEPPSGIVAWLYPLFTTPNLAFIQKCGLDAYFFLRYLRMLLKIFLPLAVVLLPILLPINKFFGHGGTGLDTLSIGNVAPKHVQHVFWAHLILALVVIYYVLHVIYSELRGYIRVRQAFLTSPQHRIRASSTTVLVTGIPEKWLTLEALSGLYDVFPGGIRNIWINRNFDDLQTKVSYRNDMAKSLENAETNLIRMCWKKHQKAEAKARKKEGKKKQSKEEKERERVNADAAAERMAQGQGVSAGDQHDTPHGLEEALEDAEQHDTQKHGLANPLDLVGEGFDAVGKNIGRFGRGFGNLGQKVVDDVDTGFHKAAGGVNHGVDAANLGAGFVVDDSLYASPDLPQGVPPTPPPKSPHFERQARLQRERNAQNISHQTEAQFDGTTARVDSNSSANQRQSHPMATSAHVHVDSLGGSRSSDSTQVPADTRFAGPSTESSKPPRYQLEIEEPAHAGGSKRDGWRAWLNHDESLAMPSPQPHTADDDEFPLNADSVRDALASKTKEPRGTKKPDSSLASKLMFWKSDTPPEVYPKAFDTDWDEDQDGDARWRGYIEPKERETMRVPLFAPTWFPSLPFVGKKVDRIYYTRRQLARLNLEIEADQNNIEKFPYMSSAFIQFNHQVAAHMACQSVSHHVPQAMAPRMVEISPDDVIWGNMSMSWWERYIRTFLVIIVCIALIVLYAIPVSFTSLLAKVSLLAQTFPWLKWLNSLPDVIIAVIEGVLPPIFLSIILALVPIIFRLLVKQQGVATGSKREQYVQMIYFAFLFIQVFLIVTISGGLTTFFTELANPTSLVNTLAQDLPSGANYFFSYLMVQAMSNSASALLQVGSLLAWFILAPILDSTARQKWRRQTNLNHIQWGSFFPPFTNFAVIGLIYSVIAPLILFFMLIIFGVFWIVYRYNVLYVYQFRNDTGGLLFPTALNQLFTGLYVLELFLIGLFFIKEYQGDVVCLPQAIIMIVALVGTLSYQILLNMAFSPLLKYLPITLEDEAVIRDEQFARAEASKFQPLNQREADMMDDEEGEERDGDHENTRGYDVVEDYDDEGMTKARAAGVDPEKRTTGYDDGSRRRSNRRSNNIPDHLSPSPVDQPRRRTSANTAHSEGGRSPAPPRSPWHHRDSNGTAATGPRSPHATWSSSADKWRRAPTSALKTVRNLATTNNASVGGGGGAPRQRLSSGPPPARQGSTATAATAIHGQTSTKGLQDVEAQRTVGDVLFSGFADELEDLTPEERDVLVRYAFQHSALRAKRPVVWIPRDRLGVSDDEIKRAEKMSTVLVPASASASEEEEREEEREQKKVEKTNIWMSNDGTALDGKGKVVFRRSPPDFSNVDLIAL